MITLLFVTLPIEIMFLIVVRALGWVKLPFVFLVLAIVFFLVAVGLPFHSLKRKKKNWTDMVLVDRLSYLSA